MAISLVVPMRRVVLLVGLVVGACSSSDAREENVPPPAPPSKRAIASSLDTARLEQAYARARELPRLRSMLVQWKGEIVAEEYCNGATRTSRANIQSASKSVIS